MAQLPSIWQVTAESGPSFPSFQGSLKVETLIIGGGITGLTTAYLLAKAGKPVTILEARTLGLGTTGRSTGNLYCVTDHSLNGLVRAYGVEKTKEVIRSRLAAIDLIEQIVVDEKISCDFRRVGFHYVNERGSAAASAFISKELSAAEKCGLNAELLRERLLPFSVHETMRIPNQGQIHPLLYVRGLARVLADKAQIFENSPALHIDADKGIVTTAEGSIEAERIVMATHIPKGIWPVHFTVSPIRELGLAMETSDTAMPYGVFWRMEVPYYSIRIMEAENKRYVLMIGENHKTGHKTSRASPYEKLRGYLQKRFPVHGETIPWSAQGYSSADHLPYYGHAKGRVYYMTGFSTDGLVFGTLGARVVSDQLLGRDNPWEELYRIKRCRPLISAPTMIKEGCDISFHYATDLVGVGTKKLEDITPGEGGLVESKEGKVAVYRNSDGSYQKVSAVCTHMKCLVKFNSTEKSWDCPCHASRFDLQGKIIEGPALKDLEPA